MDINDINIDELKAELCRRKFYYFIQEFWTEADTSTPIWNWHIEYLANELQKDVERVLRGEEKLQDIIVNCPPGTSKSMIISVLLPAWVFAVKPSTRIITASYSNTIALELSQKSRNLIEGEKYKRYFNIELKDDENTKSNYKTTKGGGRFVTSTGSNTLGMHADIIICDDIQTLDSIYSDANRRSVYEWISSTLSTRTTDKLISLSIYVQQRLHSQDSTSYLLSLPVKYKHIILPAHITNDVIDKQLIEYYNQNDGYLDKKRLNEKVLNDLKSRLGSKNYNAQILQNPESDDDSIIKKDWINIIEQIPITNVQYEYFIDSAYGGDDADFNVILECFKYNNCLYITNLIRNKDDFPTFLKSIQKFVRGNKIYIEGKASGKSFIQQLKASTNFNIVELQPKDSKITRLNSISPTVEGRRIYLIKNNWNDILLSEVCSNNPKNDDMRDCFTYAVDQKLIKENTNGNYYIR
jgi:hypothetical protein